MARTEIIARLLRARVNDRVGRRAQELRRIVIDLHQTAPRGGVNLNAFGEPRSAPGEQPAIEYGVLLAHLHQNPLQVAPGHFRVAVNRVELEYGTRHIAPRPMGALGIAELKRKT